MAIVVPIFATPAVARAITETDSQTTAESRAGEAPGAIADKSNGSWCFSVSGCINALAGFIVKLWISWLGNFLELAGYILDYTLQISIVKFSELANHDFVKEGWRTLRDISNLFFIFILLWIAVNTILGLEANTKQAIVRVVIGALLINFSFTATRTVIDSGNVLALTFYNAAKACKKEPCDGLISTKIVNALKMVELTQMISSPVGKNGPGAPSIIISGDTAKNISITAGPLGDLDFMQIVIQALGSSLFIVVTIFILLVAGLLFLRRLFYLIFLIIVSPWPFLVYAWQGNFGSWWPTLWKQVFFAPAYMAFLYVSLVILDKASPKMFDAIGGYAGSGYVGQIVFFAFAVAFMFGSLVAGNHLGAGGEKFAAWGENKLKEYGTRAGAALGRNTIGRAGNVISSASAGAAGKTGVKGIAGRLGLRAGAGLAGAGFGVKGGSLKDTREADAKKKVARHRELGELDDAAIAQEAARSVTPQAIQTEQTRVAQDLQTRINAEVQRIRQQTGNTFLTNAKYEASTAGRTMRAQHDAQNTPTLIASRLSTAAQTRVKAAHQLRATARQDSYKASLGTGPLGVVLGRQQGTRLAPASSYAALTRIGRNTQAEKNREEQVERIKTRITDLRNQANNLPQGDPTRREMETEIYRLEGQLIIANDSAETARARRTAGATPPPAPAPHP